ncbi:MAG: peptidase C39 family protein [Gammaproteobacteria bacterium]|nr:peptidase C39 family protein [Gammaproteobacteria bacterium]
MKFSALFFILLFITKTVFSLTDYQKSIAQFYNIHNTQNLTLLEVKAYQQTTNYSCGPAAIMSLLHYYHKLSDRDMNAKTELRIAKEMGSSTTLGSSSKQMATWLSQHGFEVKYGTQGTLHLLQNSLKQGIPILVDWIDWGGHWVVVTGYHATSKNNQDGNDLLFLADSSAHYDSVPSLNNLITFNADRFSTMWFDSENDKTQLIKGSYIIAVPK